jgi:hypothetical protein
MGLLYYIYFGIYTILCTLLFTVLYTVSTTLAYLLLIAAGLFLFYETACRTACIRNEDRENALRRAEVRRHWFQEDQDDMARMRACKCELDAFARSLTTDETRMLAKFLCSHHDYKRICYRRELKFEPSFSISILDTDWLKRKQKPSLHEVITAALASFQQELAHIRMCKKFAQNVLRWRLPCDDCCEAVVHALTL